MTFTLIWALSLSTQTDITASKTLWVRHWKVCGEIFSENSHLDDSGMSLPACLFKTKLKLHRLPVTSKMVKKVFADLNFS